ncbi:hypothetical protein KKD70_00885 [Patescibacteria group bacterium]|nr:hypothetical protein [Patescibacteria group bacterium]
MTGTTTPSTVTEAPSTKTTEEKVLRQITPHNFDPAKPHIYAGISKFDMAIPHTLIEVMAENIFKMAATLDAKDNVTTFKAKINQLSNENGRMLYMLTKLTDDKSVFLQQIQRNASTLGDALKSLKREIDYVGSLETRHEFHSQLVLECTDKLVPLLEAFKSTYQHHNLLHSEKAFKLKVFARWGTHGSIVARESMYIDFTFKEDIKFLGQEQDIEYATYFDILAPLISETTNGDFDETNTVFVLGFWNAIETPKNDYENRQLGIVVFNGSNHRGVIRQMANYRFTKDTGYKEIDKSFELPGESRHVHAFNAAHQKLNKQLQAAK